MADDQPKQPAGKLAQAAGQLFPLQVCKSRAGFYLGTFDADGLPFSRESQEYWPRREAAEQAISSGKWTQRLQP